MDEVSPKRGWEAVHWSIPAKHGELALDGDGSNRPFAVAMVQGIATPNVEINKSFRPVRDDVMEALEHDALELDRFAVSAKH
ncbi:MAG TPA: hypothetical protein VK635_33675 [Bradyrhizobium sp.]|nr:hypothetical protein [Bradyrhizobium sp.]